MINPCKSDSACGGSEALPALIAVAPNGASRSRDDHPALPLTPEELADCAEECWMAGAGMLHMHARDSNGQHTLDPEINKRFLDVLNDRLDDRMVIQLTTEAVGQYLPADQMKLVRSVRPEAVSLALREIIPASSAVTEGQEFLQELAENRIIFQIIIYSVADLRRYYQLRSEGVIPGYGHHLLFVVGRYAQSTEQTFASYLSHMEAMDVRWAICAFGHLEYRLTSAALALDGDVRVGFENNLCDQTGNIAPNNAALVQQSVAMAMSLGRPVMTAGQFRSALLSEVHSG